MTALPQRDLARAGAEGAGAVDGAGTWAVGTDPFWQPRRAAFWLLMLLLANGLYYTGGLFFHAFRVVPATVLLGLLAWGLYAAAFIACFRALDLLEQHPPEAFVLAFAWGGLGAVYLAAPANAAILSLAAKLVSPEFAGAWGAALAGPATEELAKLVGVLLLVLVARNQFATPLSVLIVGAMAGLAFQVVENLTYSVSAAYRFPLESQVRPVLDNLYVRGVLAGLWTHAAYTTIASAGIAWYLYHPQRRLAVRVAVALLCLGLACAMHFVWNSPLLQDSFDGLPGGLVLLLCAKGLPVLVAALLFWRVALREEGHYLHALAAYFVPERELIHDDEWLRLGAPIDRWLARRAVAREFGRKAGRLKRRLQREQLRLVRKAGTYGRGPRTLPHETAIRRLRARLPG